MLTRAQISVWRAMTMAVLLASVYGSAAAADVAKHEAPIPAATLALMRAKDTTPPAPVLIRTYKKEAELEVWKKARNGRFVLLKTFPICRSARSARWATGKLRKGSMRSRPRK